MGLPPFGQRRAGHRRPDHATAACVHRRSSRVNHSSQTRSPVAGDAAAVVGELGPTASRLRTGHTDGTSSRTSTAAGWSRTGRAEHLQAEVRAVVLRTLDPDLRSERPVQIVCLVQQR